MRGKLRDKRSETKRDTFKRELMERRRTGKRDNRSGVVRLDLQQFEDEEENLLEEDEAILVEQAKK